MQATDSMPDITPSPKVDSDIIGWQKKPGPLFISLSKAIDTADHLITELGIRLSGQDVVWLQIDFCVIRNWPESPKAQLWVYFFIYVF